MATIVLAHGAWSAAWAWKKMRPSFRAAGHEFFSPTYTGLGERAHLAHPEIDLGTHIQDVMAVLEFEDLKDVTLLGHSYGGMVATGVADRMPQAARTPLRCWFHWPFGEGARGTEGENGNRLGTFARQFAAALTFRFPPGTGH